MDNPKKTVVEHEGNEPLEFVPTVPAVTDADDCAEDDPNEILYGSDTEED
jgi:hypothetical protein